jgi:hypothetical protein
LAAFSASGKILATTKVGGSPNLGVDPFGNVWLWGGRDVRVFRGGDLSLPPKIIWHQTPTIAFDSAGDAYLSSRSRIRVYSPGADKLLAVYPFNGTVLAVDPHGVLYAYDNQIRAIVELDTTHGGAFLRTLTSQSYFVALDDQGAAYVVTSQGSSNCCNHLLKFSPGETTPAWSVHVGIVTDSMAISHGRVYLGNNRKHSFWLLIYNSGNGHFVERRRTPGITQEIRVGADGRVYVLCFAVEADQGNSIFVFDRALTRSTIRNPVVGSTWAIAVHP